MFHRMSACQLNLRAARISVRSPMAFLLTLLIGGGLEILTSSQLLAQTPTNLPTVSIVALEAMATESGPQPARFLVSRTGPTNQPLTVSYQPSGTAVDGVDYQRLSGKVTIPADTNAAVITVQPIDDALVEVTESVQLRLISSTDPFTIAILPDTQYYTAGLYGGALEMFGRQTQWIIDHRDDWNIAFALHEGDCTENNIALEWQKTKSCMDTLHGVVPYAVAVGNHDGIEFGRDDTLLFNQYFPLTNSVTAATLGGIYESNRLDNSYHLFSAGGVDWMVVSLEFGPRDVALAWANSVVTNHPERRVLVLTHAHVAADNTLLDSTNINHTEAPKHYGRENDGVDVWEKFLRHHANIAFVFNGHIGHGGQGRRIGIGDHGNQVFQMACNYQFDAYGGGGYMRLLQFYPDQDRLMATSYSPYFGASRTDSNNQFAYTNLGIFTNVTPTYLIDTQYAQAMVSLESDDLDDIPVDIDTLSASGFPSEIRVRFSKLVAPESATNVASYALSDGRPLLTARLLADGLTVVLAPIANLNPNQPYGLTATGILSRLPSSVTNPPPVSGNFSFTAVMLAADFSDGTLGDWVVVDEGTMEAPSSWQTWNGGLAQYSNIYGPGDVSSGRQGTFAYYNQPAAFGWSNYVLSVTLRSDDNDGIGVMFRYQNPQNYYKVDLDSQRNFRKLFRQVNGVETTLATQAAGYVTGTNMALRVDASGANLTVTLDGQPLFGGLVVDTNLPSGSVALYSWGNTGSRFTAITVAPTTNIPPPSISLLSPTNSALYASNATALLSALVGNCEVAGVSQVEYFTNNTFFQRAFVALFPGSLSGSEGSFFEVNARVTDGMGRQTWATPVGVTFGALPPSQLRLYRTLQGDLQLALVPPAAYTFALEASSNLVVWESLGLMTNLNSALQSVDPASTNAPVRFYRTLRPGD